MRTSSDWSSLATRRWASRRCCATSATASSPTTRTRQWAWIFTRASSRSSRACASSCRSGTRPVRSDSAPSRAPTIEIRSVHSYSTTPPTMTRLSMSTTGFRRPRSKSSHISPSLFSSALNRFYSLSFLRIYSRSCHKPFRILL